MLLQNWASVSEECTTMVYKCKMCGGTIEFEPGSTVGVCDSCGTKQTLPKTDSEVLSNLFNRANNLRLKCEFDKAEQIYEKIVEEDDSEAEAHWGIVLCKYGIEYVEDPKTFERIPTCHRTLYEPITSDVDYLATIDYSDASQQVIYEKEARAIDRIQKGILEIVRNEKPFDVFICYKETDENGKRTVDSAIANDIYYQLTQEGLKVFYAPITLEDKVGQEYEPYIFAALNSAKVMLVIGTKPEYFNAVWVKNEWSRFMKLMKTDRSKLLIPCYRDMDAYDLPEEFAHLQAQDMGKIGFINDVVRGIRKVVTPDTVKTAPVSTGESIKTGTANIQPLLKRAFLFLESGDWDKADDFCEQVLNQDPENAQAYLGKLMAELHVSRQEELNNCPQPFDDRNYYQMALRFGDSKLKDTLRSAIVFINERNENIRLEGIYVNAQKRMNSASSEEAFKKAASEFETILGYKDSELLQTQCLELAKTARKDSIYAANIAKMESATQSGFESAINGFKSISGWKDADQQIQICIEKIKELKVKQEQARIKAEKAAKRRKKIIVIVALAAIVCFAFAYILKSVIIQKLRFNKAMNLIEAGEYETAYAILREIGKTEEIASNKYDRAMEMIDSGDYEAAYLLLENIGKTEEIASNKYDRALKYIEAEDYELAYEILRDLKYKDSEEKMESIKSQYYSILMSNIKKAQVGSYIGFGSYEQDGNTSNGAELIEWLVLAKEDDRILVISRYALDCKPFDITRTNVTWQTCSLRTWLNLTFIDTAFSPEEQSLIPSVPVSADDNPYKKTDPGKDTTDKLFLLSIIEANDYFDKDETRSCMATKYASYQGVTTSNDGRCWWWLRTPGDVANKAACVSFDGTINSNGNRVVMDGKAVRPAMWIVLEP